MCSKSPGSPYTRRSFLSRSAGATLAATGFGLWRPAQAQEGPVNKLAGDEALDRLMEGNKRYTTGTRELDDLIEEMRILRQGQAPNSVILCCSDSRVVPEILFDDTRGSLFVVRVAGNVLNVDGLASIEFAVKVLGSTLVMVLGHEACGAVAATISVLQENAQLPGHLPKLIASIKPAVEAAEKEAGPLLANSIDWNVRLTMDKLRASRRIARAILRARSQAPITTTLALAQVIESCLPRAKPGQSHPATRSFQALRIAVNDEYGELFQGLMASERALKPGGRLAVVTFHSIEDRMVKRFLQARAGQTGRANRYAPEIAQDAPQFTLKSRKAIGPDDRELAENPAPARPSCAWPPAPTPPPVPSTQNP